MNRLAELSAEGCPSVLSPAGWSSTGTGLSDRPSAFQDALEKAAERHAPGKHVRMPSAAGHDAQIFARHVKAGMLFIPSIGGISHHYTEDTSDADIVLGAQAFADAAAEIVERG